MTAREKFEARLKELGLALDYEVNGDKTGKVLPDGSIVVLVHYPGDPYTELHYPPYNELWKNDKFKKKCMENFFENEDDKFVADLARWLQYGPGCHYECPLFPVDLDFAASGLETKWFNYEDDSPINLYGREWQEFIGPFEPDEDRDWLVAKLPEGDMWMNNESGHVILVKPDGNYLVSLI